MSSSSSSERKRPSKRLRSVPNVPVAAEGGVPAEFGSLRAALDPVAGDELARLQGRIRTLTGARGNKDRLPGPQPYAVTRRKLQLLREREYWVCEKSDGLRLMLLLSRDGAFFADRKFGVYKVRDGDTYVQAVGGCARGETLVDGELVQSLASGRPDVFMLFDAMAEGGVSCVGEPYKRRIDRLIAIGGACINAFKGREGELPFAVLPKKFYKKGDVGYLLQHKILRPAPPQRPYYSFVDEKMGINNKNDGLVFTPQDTPYLNADGSLLKWKWPGMNTVDLLLRAEDVRLGAEVPAFVAAPANKTAQITTVMLSQADRDRVLAPDQTRDSVVAECAYDRGAGVWRVKNWRMDKEGPNYVTTAWNTLETIVDNVTEKDLCEATKA